MNSKCVDTNFFWDIVFVKIKNIRIISYIYNIIYHLKSNSF